MPRKSNTRAPQGVGSIRKRKDGTYEGRYTIGRDPGTGRQVQKSVYAKTEAEVVKKLRSPCKTVMIPRRCRITVIKNL